MENLFLETNIAWDSDKASGHYMCQEASFSCQLLAKESALSTDELPRRLTQEQCG